MIRHRLLAQRSLLCAALLLSVYAHARTFDGLVTHVSDGDSLWVRMPEGGAPREVRLQGIDAPEICQAWGPQARAALQSMALRRTVVVRTRARDRYDRIVGRVSIGSRDLGASLVARGDAWSDGWRGRGGPYARQEAAAREARLGLWAAEAPMPPREFRRRHGSCR
jgi:micrococcal nuclease